MLRPLPFLAVLLLLGACSQAVKDPYADWSAKQLYDSARASLDAGEFEQAVELFETLEARYPFGQYALQTQLDIAYAYYKFDEMESAIAAAERFIKLNPRHANVDYAYYLKGLAHYNSGRGIFENLFPRDLANVDQSVLQSAYREFETLLNRFPDSLYADDARQRMVYLRNKMAEHEYRTASYYFRRGALAGSVNRVKFLLERYDGAPVVPDALALMVRAYRAMQLPDLAADALEVLRSNYPAHPALGALAAERG